MMSTSSPTQADAVTDKIFSDRKSAKSEEVEEPFVYRDYANCSVVEQNGAFQLVRQTANGAKNRISVKNSPSLMSAACLNLFANIKAGTPIGSTVGLSSALTNSTTGNPLIFPVKLHLLLTASETDEDLASIISYQPHGRSFHVYDRSRFVDEVLSKWFLQTQYESFQRQLNLYGFRRLTRGPDKGAHFHPMFLRQMPDLLPLIHRIRLKGTGPRKPANPEEEPNLYALRYLPAAQQPQAAEPNPQIHPASHPPQASRSSSNLGVQQQHQNQYQSIHEALRLAMTQSMVHRPPTALQARHRLSFYGERPLPPPPPVMTSAKMCPTPPTAAMVVTVPSSPVLPPAPCGIGRRPTAVEETLTKNRYFISQEAGPEEDDDGAFAGILADLAGGRFGA